MKKRNEDKEPSLVTLGPFTPKAIVQFDEVPVTKTARRVIIVENPYTENIKVTENTKLLHFIKIIYSLRYLQLKFQNRN